MVSSCAYVYMGVSKNRGTPKWMVYFMENPIKWMIWGVLPPIFGSTPIYMFINIGVSNWSFIVPFGARCGPIWTSCWEINCRDCVWILWVTWVSSCGCWTKNRGFWPPNYPILIGFGTIIFTIQKLGYQYFWKHPCKIRFFVNFPQFTGWPDS